MIRRLDANGNGMIDPDESSGRARYMLERFARDIPGIDLNRPISVDKLTKGLEQLRGGRPSSSSEPSSSSRGAPSTPGARPVEEPLVPGFGIDDGMAPPPGFGTRGDAVSIKVTDADLREAEDRLRRYDENRDGYLDKAEMGRNRWSDDPFVYDQNRDGRLSSKELAVRYAKRRSGDGAQRESSSDRRSPPSSSFPTFAATSSTPGAAPAGGDARTEQMMRFMMDRYDTNKSGVIEKEEWGSFRSDPSAFDANKDNKISREELAAYLQSRMSSGGFGGPGGGPPGGFGGRPPSMSGGSDGDRRDRGDRGDRGDRRDRGDSSSSFYTRSADGAATAAPTTAKKSDRKSYRSLTSTERLPKGLPEWFPRNDSNADGQVAMAEFSASWSNSTAAEFAQFDLNGDGLITAKECLQATDKGVARGASTLSTSSSSVSRTSSVPSASSAPAAATAAPLVVASQAPAPTTGSPPAAAPATPSAPIPADVKLDSKTLAFSQERIKKYDKNQDGALTKDEWSSMSKDISPADRDGDGRITPTEYAIFTVTK